MKSTQLRTGSNPFISAKKTVRVDIKTYHSNVEEVDNYIRQRLLINTSIRMVVLHLRLERLNPEVVGVLKG